MIPQGLVVVSEGGCVRVLVCACVKYAARSGLYVPLWLCKRERGEGQFLSVLYMGEVL